MPTPLRLLILEDCPADAELMLYELRQAGFEPDWQRVETKAHYLAQLRQDLDVILADYALPNFDALHALYLLRERGLDIPFIIVSGRISEEAAVECMKQGAADYLLKDRLARLGPAVARALQEKKLRDEKRRAEAALRESEERYRRRTAQLEALREVGLELTAQLNLEALLHSIVSQAMELLGGTAGGLALYQPEQDVLEATMSVGDAAVSLGSTFRRGEGLSGKIWETGEPLVVDDYQHWEGRAASYEALSIPTVVGVPIRWGEEFLGTLIVQANAPRTFSSADVELLRLFAAQAAIAIQNARLYEQARQDAKTKSVLLREVNHRVKNNLAAIIGLLRAARYHVGMEDQPTYQSIMYDLINQVQGLATVHKLLSASEWAPLLLSELTTQVIRSSLKMLPRGKNVSVDVAPSPIRVTPDQAHNLALAINELVTNTVKYALQEQNAVGITVRIAIEDDMVLFEFRNDGPGYPAEVLRLERHSLGFDLIQDIVHKGLGGELTLRNDPGAVAIIRFQAKAQGE